MRRLTDKGALWTWQSQQEEAFQNVKRLVSHQPVLKYYNVHEEVTIQCDESEVGLGATLITTEWTTHCISFPCIIKN